MPRGYRRVLRRPDATPSVRDLRSQPTNAASVTVAAPEIPPASDNPPAVDLGDVSGPEPVAESVDEPVKRKRGRPRKNPDA